MKPGTTLTRKVVADKKTMIGKTVVDAGPMQGAGDVVFRKRITKVPTGLCPPSSVVSNSVRCRLSWQRRWGSWYARTRALKCKKLHLFTSHANVIYWFTTIFIIFYIDSPLPPFFVLHWTAVSICSSPVTLLPLIQTWFIVIFIAFYCDPPLGSFFLFSTRLQRVFALVPRPFYFPC